MDFFEEKIKHQAQHADYDDSGHDMIGVQKPFGPHHHGADPG